MALVFIRKGWGLIASLLHFHFFISKTKQNLPSDLGITQLLRNIPWNYNKCDITPSGAFFSQHVEVQKSSKKGKILLDDGRRRTVVSKKSEWPDIYLGNPSGQVVSQLIFAKWWFAWESGARFSLSQQYIFFHFPFLYSLNVYVYVLLSLSLKVYYIYLSTFSGFKPSHLGDKITSCIYVMCTLYTVQHNTNCCVLIWSNHIFSEDIIGLLW